MNAPESHREDMNEITERIIGCAYEVSKVLGCGFLEKVYENALMHEMLRQGLGVKQQVPMSVYYDDVVVGDYVADIVVEGRVLVELKAVSSLDDIHRAQCLNYLNATGLHVCLLLNFGRPKLEVKRLVHNF
jgi:GxxExxY protein